MDKRGAKGYCISTARIINQDLFDEYVNKVGPWLKKVGGQLFAKDTEPHGKERTEDANLAVICEFPSMISPLFIRFKLKTFFNSFLAIKKRVYPSNFRSTVK